MLPLFLFINFILFFDDIPFWGLHQFGQLLYNKKEKNKIKIKTCVILIKNK